MSDKQEETLNKYKRLLTLARSNLEANQASLADKDKQITSLRSALDDVHRGKLSMGNGTEESSPKHLSRRVDVEGRIWILVEYDAGADDKWVEFSTEDELDDFVARLPGVPLEKPRACLTVDESSAVEVEAQRKVERIVEEFRRYKVRAEIARKQKDAEFKLARSAAAAASPAPRAGAREGAGSPAASLASAMSEGTTGYMDVGDAGAAAGAAEASELSRVRTQLAEQDGKWRTAYEKVTRENEVLRSGGSEAMLAAQWRARFESCQTEKEALTEKLAMFLRPSGGVAHGGPASIEKAFMELRNENKDLRRRLGGGGGGSDGSGRRPRRAPSSSSSSSIASGSSGGVSSDTGPLAAAKVQYLRQLLYKYLSSSEVGVREHMETALITLLRFNEQERKDIDGARRALSDSADPLGVTEAISSLFS